MSTTSLSRCFGDTDSLTAWAKQGIVGRGVLVDFVSYAARNNIKYDPLDNYYITLDTVQKIAAECNFAFRAGDIILLRTGQSTSHPPPHPTNPLTQRHHPGFTAAFETTSLPTKKTILSKSPFQYPGLESTFRVLAFLWDTQIAAVAGDCPGFEAWPPSEQAMHQILLSGFGMPIGELFDLEALAKECEAQRRWTFFFTSQVLNVQGGVASPPNAIAIF